MNKPLSHLKVLELATVLAGPAVGMFFAELGAEVIKVEPPTGDVTRSWKSKGEESSSISAYYASINYGKKVIRLDFKNKNDLKQVHDLIRESDIVLTNFKASSAQKFQLDYSSLKSINPNIILGEITGFKHGDRPAYDVILQAESGFMFMNGSENGLPTKMPVALIDVLAAHQLKEGLLVALLSKEAGKSKHVRVSLEEAAVSSLMNQATNYLMNDNIPARMGSLHPNIAPYGEILKTQDNRMIVLAIGSNHQFASLCRILNCAETSSDARFLTNQLRVENRDSLFEILQTSAEMLLFQDLYKSCLEDNVPVGEIKSMDQVMKTDVATEMLRKEIIESTETVRISGIAFNID